MAGDGDDHRESPLQSSKREAIDDDEEVSKMEDENSEVSFSEMDIDELRETLRKQKETIEQLKYELDEERNASGVAAEETLAKINRLQREKHDMERQAILSKRLQVHAEQEKRSLQYHLDQKDYAIEKLQAELQSLKQRMQFATSVENHLQEKRSLQELLEKKDVVIEELQSELQSLKLGMQLSTSVGDHLQVNHNNNNSDNHNDHSNNVNVNGILKSDDENNCMISVTGDEVQRLNQKIQSLEEEKASMALTIKELLTTKNMNLRKMNMRLEAETQPNIPVEIQNPSTPISTTTKPDTTPHAAKVRRFGMALLHASIWVAILYSEIRSRFK